MLSDVGKTQCMNTNVDYSENKARSKTCHKPKVSCLLDDKNTVRSTLTAMQVEMFAGCKLHFACRMDFTSDDDLLWIPLDNAWTYATLVLHEPSLGHRCSCSVWYP